MPTSGPEPLRHVSDTALWVAAYRAEESERSDALFQDPYARALTGERGFRLLEAIPKGRSMAWPMVVRTVLMDQIVRERIAAGCDFVVNLAAGLDARPYRMGLPPDLSWFEVDLPAMIQYKSEILRSARPVCRLERIGADLADAASRAAVLSDLGSRGERGLVITEGLLIYLEPSTVDTLARELSAAASLRWWTTDLASPALLKMLRGSFGKAVAEAGAPFRFGPEDGTAFFVERGWREAEIHSAFHTAARLGRLPWIWSLVARVVPEPKRWKPSRVWSGICLFERSAEGA